MANNSDKYEYFRFPLLPTLFSGIFLILILRLYWEPSIYLGQPLEGSERFLKHYSVWGPIFKYGVERVKSGEFPHWNPYQLCGHPYLIEPRTGLFQPLNLFFYFFNFAEAYQMTVLLGMFLLGISFIIWGRVWGVNFLALIPGSIALIFSGFTVWAQLSLTFLNGCIWLSLLTSSVLISLELRSIRSFVVLLVSWCMLILSGSFECILAGAGFTVVIPLLLRKLYFSPREKKVYPFFVIFIILVLGIGITAFSWLPSLIWVLTEGDKNVMRWLSLESIPINQSFPSSLNTVLYQLIYPITNSDTNSVPIFYLGLIPLTVLIPAFFDRESRKSAFYLLIIIGLCISLYYLDLRIARSLRIGSSIILIQSFLLLFSIGYNRTFLKGSDITSPYIWGSILTLVVSSILIIFFGNIWAKGILSIYLFTMLILSLLRFNWLKAVGCIITSLIIFLELFYPLRQSIPISYTSTIKLIESKSTTIRDLKNFTAIGRTYLRNVDEQTIFCSENIGMDVKWQLVNGKWEFTSERHKRWLQAMGSNTELNLPLLTASGVRWVCNEKRKGEKSITSEEGWRPIEKFPNIELRENPQFLPRAYIVSNLKKEENFESLLNNILNKEVDLSNICIIEEGLPNIGQGESSYESSAIVDEISPEHVVVNVSAPKDSFLVLLDTYAMGWKSKIDGVDTKLYRTNGIFRGVIAPEGSHKIEFYYNTPGWRESWIFSGAVLIFSTILLRTLRRRLQD
ncbi:MAG: YfhO family protein [Candidatus Hydrogenedentes bacterium]|nr:YfhO family protein [Candidatus Hydrogenedentota bacterium]